MYNQYIASPREDMAEVHNEPRKEAVEAMARQPAPPMSPPPPPPQQHPNSAFGCLSQALGSRFGTIKFDAETLIALVVVWFLINDGEDLDTELLLMVGILLILGV